MDVLAQDLSPCSGVWQSSSWLEKSLVQIQPCLITGEGCMRITAHNPLKPNKCPLTLFRLDIQPHIQKNLYPNRNWIWVSSPPYPKALKHPPLLLCSPSLCQWHTSQWLFIQYKHKEILLCYYLHCASLILTPNAAPTPSNPQPIPDILSLHLYIQNCQSQSNLWNI